MYRAKIKGSFASLSSLKEIYCDFFQPGINLLSQLLPVFSMNRTF